MSHLTSPGRRGAVTTNALLEFQHAFLRELSRPAVRTAVFSAPRGNGKSFLAARLAAAVLTPGSELFVSGAESHLVAGSLSQARRTLFSQLRHALSGKSSEYRFAESTSSVHAIHLATGTRVSCLAANPKTAQGIVNCPWLIADEPGAWEVAAGEAMYAAIRTAQGKPGSPLRVVFVGTLAPAVRGWWPELVRAGSRGSTHVTSLEGDPSKWRDRAELERVNPLMWAFPESRATLLEERDAAIADSRLKAQFLSFRLNYPSADESTVLLTVDDWQRIESRRVPPPVGRPVCGVDLGAGRAWSAAAAVWPNGRCEAFAVCPGIPDIAEQEKRDRQPAGTYQALVDSGRLRVAEGLRVPPPALLMDAVRQWGGRLAICDRFRLAELQDCVPQGVRVLPRVTRWSEAAQDVRALRKAARDGALAVVPESRPLLEASLSAATVRNDDQGNVRLEKRGHNNEARDDVAAALLLAAGALARLRKKPASGKAVVCEPARLSH